MLNLDQVRLLENRVERAVDRIQNLTAENRRLTTELETVRKRVQDLEGLVNSFRNDQGRIEEGILNALERLSAFEEAVLTTPEANEPESQATGNPDADNSAVPASQIEAEWDNMSEESSENTESTEHRPDPSIQENPDGQIGIF